MKLFKIILMISYFTCPINAMEPEVLTNFSEQHDSTKKLFDFETMEKQSPETGCWSHKKFWQGVTTAAPFLATACYAWSIGDLFTISDSIIPPFCYLAAASALWYPKLYNDEQEEEQITETPDANDQDENFERKKLEKKLTRINNKLTSNIIACGGIGVATAAKTVNEFASMIRYNDLAGGITKIVLLDIPMALVYSNGHHKIKTISKKRADLLTTRTSKFTSPATKDDTKKFIAQEQKNLNFQQVFLGALATLIVAKEAGILLHALHDELFSTLAGQTHYALETIANGTLTIEIISRLKAIRKEQHILKTRQAALEIESV